MRTMSCYEREYSNFPDQKITLHRFKNVTDELAETINKINELKNQGLYEQAERYIGNNADVLAQYCPDAVTINTMIEEIYNTQIYARQMQQCIYFDAEEPEALCEDVWIGGD